MNAMQITKNVKTFLRDEQGLTMVEYAIAGALVAATAAVTFVALGEQIIIAIQSLIDNMSPSTTTP